MWWIQCTLGIEEESLIVPSQQPSIKLCYSSYVPALTQGSHDIQHHVPTALWLL